MKRCKVYTETNSNLTSIKDLGAEHNNKMHPRFLSDNIKRKLGIHQAISIVN